MNCEVCEKNKATDKHHYLPGASRNIPVGQADGAGRIQRIIALCRVCHSSVHALPQDRFFQKYRKHKKQFIRINSNQEIKLNAGDVVYDNFISEEKKRSV